MEKSEDRVRKATSKIKEIVSHPDIISGIHNYCDRWCERCTHTKHCSVFKMEEFHAKEVRSRDIKNNEFWESVSFNFQLTANLLQEMAEEAGIDLHAIDEEDLVEENIRQEIAKKAKAGKLSRSYGLDGFNWFKKQDSAFKKKFELFFNIKPEILEELNDAIEVVQFYMMFIGAKTYRACMPPFETEGVDNEDGRGSAKIAIIAIERSMGCWVIIMESFPEFEDDILGFLKTLSEVKRLLLAKFPDAMEFKRPGFDYIPVKSDA